MALLIGIDPALERSLDSEPSERIESGYFLSGPYLDMGFSFLNNLSIILGVLFI